MERTLKEALKHRRSYYALSDQSPVADAEIEEMIKFVLTYMPSAFNSQSSRLVLLLNEHHKRFWEIVKETLQRMISEPAYEATEAKIDKSFLSGYGTVLFFEDRSVVEHLQQAYPLYRDKFPEWSEQTSGMHQLIVWTLLEDAGFGASLQHYNPLVDAAVAAEWKLPESWRLVAEMPFGTPVLIPEEREVKPLEERMRFFK